MAAMDKNKAVIAAVYDFLFDGEEENFFLEEENNHADILIKQTSLTEENLTPKSCFIGSIQCQITLILYSIHLSI